MFGKALLLCLLLAGLTGCVRAEAAVQAEGKQKAAVVTAAETEHAEKENPAAVGGNLQKPTKPIPKITGPKSSLKKKVKPEEPAPTESETPPTETGPTPTSSRRATPQNMCHPEERCSEGSASDERTTAKRSPLDVCILRAGGYSLRS